MNGAESLVRTAIDSGIEVCFANPGTTEMPLVAALDSIPGIRAILGLFEGVCTGAADGYARMLDRPALTLTHLGPGFANGIANLHNARRAHVPVVNVVGDHAAWHLPFDPPLASDIVSLARPVSGWIRTAASASGVAGDMAETIAAAGHAPGQTATLIVPENCQWDPADKPALPLPLREPAPFDHHAVEHAASLLRHGPSSALLLGGLALREHGLNLATRIAEATGCSLLCDFFFSRAEHGFGIVPIRRIPYVAEAAIEMLASFKSVVLAGAAEPVIFFGYPNTPSRPISKQCVVASLTAPEADVGLALEELAAFVKAPKESAARTAKKPDRPTGALTPKTIGLALAAAIPEDAILMDEGITSGFMAFDATSTAKRFTYLTHTGGAIGQGLPVITGAAVACPNRRCIALQADGSALYTVQALWTQAREQLPVVTLICSNHRYRILEIELARTGVAEPRRNARELTRFDNPEINWVELSRSMGVPGVCINTAERLTSELEKALQEPGPHLIEAIM